MATSTKSRGSLGLPAFVLVTALLALALAKVVHLPVRPGIGRDDDQDRLMLSAVWTPTPRREPLDIRVSVGPGPGYAVNRTSSPWNAPVVMPKGTQVLLSVTQWQPGRLDCFIHRGAQQVDHSFREGVGAIRCWANRKGG